MIDFAIIPGEYTNYEIWKTIDEEKTLLVGMLDDIAQAMKLVDILYKVYSKENVWPLM